KLQRDAPRVILGAVVVVVLAVTLASDALFGGLASATEQGELDLMRAILAFNLKGAEDRAYARAEMIAQLPLAREAVAARDRPRLLAEYGPMFKVQKEKHGVD